jgi:hypothetical protein
LASVFSARSEQELHARIACLCVLFEDLRIELAGQAAQELGGLDECGNTGRQLYFIRRSIATLYEFAAVVQELEQVPSFRIIRASFDARAGRQWKRATAYFRKYDRYVKQLRHNVGGHFGSAAGKLAIKGLLPHAVGRIEVRFTDSAEGGTPLFFFASEIAATGTLCHVPGATIPAKTRRLFRHAYVGYRWATMAVDCITIYYLWERFGK